MIQSIKSGFHVMQLVGSGTVVGRYSTPWKGGARIVTGNRASVLTWSDSPVTSTVTITPLAIKAGRAATSGSPAGSLDFVVNGAPVTVPLVLDGSISMPDGWWRLTHPEVLLGASHPQVAP